MASKKIYCVFDTETLGVDNKWIYDLGMIIINKKGEVLTKKRWIIKEIMEIPGIERLAYYGSKIPVFYKGLETVSFLQTKQEFNQLLEEYQVTTITAYNLQFDMSAITDTLTYTGIKGKFLNKNYEYFDLWNASCDSFFQQKKFKETAVKENWLTEKGNIRTSAEIAYRYITNNYQFIETHTALEDAEIEGAILCKVLQQKKKIIRNKIVADPWRKIKKPDRPYTREQYVAYCKNIVICGYSPHPADIILPENYSPIIYSGGAR